MRTSIEKLAWLLWKDEEIHKGTISDAAEKYGETTERIMDALDVIKIARGELSIIPPLDWSG